MHFEPSKSGSTELHGADLQSSHGQPLTVFMNSVQKSSPAVAQPLPTQTSLEAHSCSTEELGLVFTDFDSAFGSEDANTSPPRSTKSNVQFDTLPNQVPTRNALANSFGADEPNEAPQAHPLASVLHATPAAASSHQQLSSDDSSGRSRGVLARAGRDVLSASVRSTDPSFSAPRVVGGALASAENGRGTESTSRAAPLAQVTRLPPVTAFHGRRPNALSLPEEYESF